MRSTMWTKEEERLLITNFKSNTYFELSKIVGRSEGYIKGKIERLGLIKRNNKQDLNVFGKDILLIKQKVGLK